MVFALSLQPVSCKEEEGTQLELSSGFFLQNCLKRRLVTSEGWTYLYYSSTWKYLQCSALVELRDSCALHWLKFAFAWLVSSVASWFCRRIQRTLHSWATLCHLQRGWTFLSQRTNFFCDWTDISWNPLNSLLILPSAQACLNRCQWLSWSTSSTSRCYGKCWGVE